MRRHHRVEQRADRRGQRIAPLELVPVPHAVGDHVHPRLHREPPRRERVGVDQHGQAAGMALTNHIADHLERGRRQVPDGTVSALLEGFDADAAVGRDPGHGRLRGVIFRAKPGGNRALLTRVPEKVGEEVPVHLLRVHRHRVAVRQRERGPAIVRVRVERRGLEPVEETALEHDQIDDRGEPREQIAPRQLLGVGVGERPQIQRDRERHAGRRREVGVTVDEARDEHAPPADDHGIPEAGGRAALTYRRDAVVLEDDVAVLDRRRPLGRDDGDVTNEDPVRQRVRLKEGRGQQSEEHGAPGAEVGVEVAEGRQ